MSLGLTRPLADRAAMSPFDWLQPKRVFAGRNHGKGNWGAVTSAMHVARFKPCTKPWIEDVRMSLPELW